MPYSLLLFYKLYNLKRFKIIYFKYIYLIFYNINFLIYFLNYIINFKKKIYIYKLN
jgi:hypothetical protein